MNRREAIKVIGAGAAGGAILPSAVLAGREESRSDLVALSDHELLKLLDTQVTDECFGEVTGLRTTINDLHGRAAISLCNRMIGTRDSGNLTMSYFPKWLCVNASGNQSSATGKWSVQLDFKVIQPISRYSRVDWRQLIREAVTYR